MNERIKQLEMQVARSFDPLKDWDCSEQEYAAEFNRRFAELIVRQCADITDSIGEHGYIASEEMLEQFGVEE